MCIWTKSSSSKELQVLHPCPHHKQAGFHFPWIHGFLPYSFRNPIIHPRHISYGALSRNSVPCSQRGTSYYNGRPGTQANSCTRGCSAITRAAAASPHHTFVTATIRNHLESVLNVWITSQVMQLIELEVFISTRKVHGSHSIEKVIPKDDRRVSSAERPPNSFWSPPSFATNDQRKASKSFLNLSEQPSTMLMSNEFAILSNHILKVHIVLSVGRAPEICVIISRIFS